MARVRRRRAIHRKRVTLKPGPANNRDRGRRGKANSAKVRVNPKANPVNHPMARVRHRMASRHRTVSRDKAVLKVRVLAGKETHPAINLRVVNLPNNRAKRD